MRKAGVIIGKTYVVKVSGKLSPVRVTRTCEFGGWYGTNVRTEREIRIRSAAKLRKEYVMVSEKRTDEELRYAIPGILPE